VTVVAEVKATVQGPVPLQPPPLQPTKVDPVVEAAVSVTIVPWLNDSVQSVGQLIPAGDDVIVPEPVPAGEAVSK
jgi:hypothetical protein